jgi:cytochrome c-type biogenesis protein CcmH
MTVHVGGRPTVRGPGRDALLLLLALAVTAGTLLALGMSGGTRSPDLSAQAHQVASTLRCPVCADLSAADSPSPMAAEMRRQVLRDLQRGRSPDQIRAGFVSAYGPSVLMTPPRSGVGSVAYVLPVLVVLAAAATGAMLLRRLLRRPSGTREEEPG